MPISDEEKARIQVVIAETENLATMLRQVEAQKDVVIASLATMQSDSGESESVTRSVELAARMVSGINVDQGLLTAIKRHMEYYLENL